MRDIDELRRRKRRGEDLTDEETQRLEEYWRSGHTSTPTRQTHFLLDAPNSPFSDFVADCKAYGEQKQRERVASGCVLSCSYCGKPVSREVATFGKASKVYTKWEITTNPEFDMDEVLVYKNQKVVACPDHCLEIKPRLSKTGEYLGHNITFPEDEG